MPRPSPVSVKRLEELVEKYGTPLQLYDGDAIVENARALLKNFRSEFPSFKQFFAVKALPNPAILKLLVNEGFGLDCSSTSELYIAKKLGVPGEMTMYTSNYTSKKDLGIAFDQGAIVNLDDVSLVDAMVEARGKCPDLISFRLNPGLGRTDSETASNVLGGPNAKFGVPPFQIVEAYRKAKEAGATRFGIHMMTGSCVLNEDYWMDTVSVLLDTMDKLHKELDITFEFCNLGGGLGVAYKPDQAQVDVPSLVAKLKAKFESAMPEAFKDKWPNLYMENGRYITGPYGFLVARCQAIKNSYETYYGLDACMANLMRPGMYNSYHHIYIPTAEERGTEEKEANVVGTLCENNDWFAKKRLLPQAQVGDLFVIADTGAHSHSMGFQYNGKLRAPEVLLRNAGADDALIREGETIEGLFANTHMPEDLAN
ncbi:Diaminopimelate decarboxylase [Hondaea fermentalgiana]|uniref:Diaminopimelate decarboxylase n=1 Tax=Hondaea fermentalgiana TaxID=2315210 RepID=A0A2R5GRZ5_9STRA|nr:Diaminopimelate decarboxylase [Hondaea fermentalgiana]|eukprot:GBG33657.1 Diaminopimelate decarboxylase [Hondaea fermentalgiana]